MPTRLLIVRTDQTPRTASKAHGEGESRKAHGEGESCKAQTAGTAEGGQIAMLRRQKPHPSESTAHLFDGRCNSGRFPQVPEEKLALGGLPGAINSLLLGCYPLSSFFPDFMLVMRGGGTHTVGYTKMAQILSESSSNSHKYSNTDVMNVRETTQEWSIQALSLIHI